MKELTQYELNLNDLKYYDPELFQSLKYIQDNEFEPEDLALTFTVMDEGEEV
jgi:hypothetical protein